MTKRFGFTLAEVLITLGIIGVVAAMTIPTLMSNTSDAQFKTAFKKSLSVMNQAVLMQLAMADTDFSNLEADASASTVPGSMGELLSDRMNSATDITSDWTATTNTYPSSISYEITCTDADVAASVEGCTAAGDVTDVDKTVSASAVKVYQFADNTAFGYFLDEPAEGQHCTASTPCHGFIDVNGAKRPNQVTTGVDAINDIFPVIYFDQTVRPDEAGVAVLGQ